ncbi:CTD kinase subunit alpha [Caerostris extrusa]|uniref:cyclin-dependent kinase n=1 Tax=Caerostris extrusa TaxID=172846 RepID=A0AAV4M873_CAEEX|nr:CTD kinase subunit alpha [Caerostris extrusa]
MSNFSESNDSSFGDPPTTSEEGVEMMSFKFEPFRIPPSVQVGNCRLITDYKKISVIGEGAFSKVFKAKDNKTDKLVALKKLRIEEKNLEGMPINYLREIMVLQDLDHENIVKLYEVVVGRSFESTYLVLEYCPFELSKVLDDDEAKRLIDHSHIKAIYTTIIWWVDLSP